MSAVWMRFRSELRTRWVGTLGVALLVGLAGAAVLAAGAGARRTNSTLARVARDQRLPDVLVNPDGNENTPEYLAAWAAIDHLPDVESVASLEAVLAAPVDDAGRADLRAAQDVMTLTSPDGNLLRTIDRPRLLSGRYPDPARSDEIIVNAVEAKRAHVRPGSRMHLGIFAQDDFQRENEIPAPRVAQDFTVTGVTLGLDEAGRAPDDPHLSPSIVFTPALRGRLGVFTPPYIGKEVRLRDGSKGLPAFEAAVRGAFRDLTIADDDGRKPVNMNFQESSLTVARARRAVRPYALALWLFALLAALAALAVIGQTIVRSMRPLREERDRLTAIGFTRHQLVQCAALRGAIIGLVGAAVAFALAVATSPLVPIGPLRKIEPDRGVHIDWLVLGLGVAVIALLVALTASFAVRRAHSPRTGADPASERLARAGAPVPLVTGVRFALDRGRDATVPVRSTLIGVTIAVAALVASLVYGSAMTRFTGSPRRYGWPWSYQVVVDPSEANPTDVAREIERTPGVTATGSGVYSQFDIRGRSVAAVGIERAPGVAFLPLLSGRAPEADDEIVLGAKTMNSLHASIGDRIPVTAQSGTRDFRVVGSAVFPRLAPYPGSEPTGLGIGAATTAKAVEQLGAALGSPFFVVQTRSGTKLSAAKLTSASGGPESVFVVGPQRPNDVLSYDRLSTTPMILAAVLALLALGSAVHLLVTGVRSRRRDVALLKAIGVTGRQARLAVLVQATVLVGLALVVALPAGFLAGRWLWAQTAHWLGVAADPAVPVGALTLLVVVAFALANLIAIGPAIVSARIRPAVALRTE